MIHLDSISKHYGKQLLFVETSAVVLRGERVGLVGPNGAGKTTIFRMILGEEQPDEGQVRVESGHSIGYFSQDVGEMSGRSVVTETIDGAGPVAAMASELAQLEEALADPARADEMEALIDRYGEVQAHFVALDGYSLDARAREILAGLGFRQEVMDGDVGALSGGWKMRVALARILLMRPDVLLLDEPTNHLDLESSESLAEALRSFDGTLLFVSHNRAFVRALATRIWDVHDGEVEVYPGTLDEYMEHHRRRLEGETDEPAKDAPRRAPSPARGPSKGSGASAPTARSQGSAEGRGSAKERRRREAELRRARDRRLGPLKKRVAKLEASIAELEERQRECSAQLADPATYEDEKRRSELIDAYQRDAEELEGLNSAWEIASAELEDVTAAAEAELSG